MKGALAALAVLALAYPALWLPWVEPLLAERNRLARERDQVQAEKLWVRGLRERSDAAATRQKSRAAAIAEIETFFLRDESERLRMAKARDAALQGLDLQVTPLEAGAAERITFDSDSDPNLELAKLKSQFLSRYPRVQLEKWELPASTGFLRLEERIKMEGGYQPLFAFLSKVQAGSLFMEVTRLELECDPGADPAERVAATVAVSSLVLTGTEVDR